MSVTFSVTTTRDDVFLWDLTCDVAGKLTNEPMPWDRAQEMASEHKAACSDDLCRHYGPDKTSVGPAGVRTDLDVNVSNFNAVGILDVLGLDTDDLCGSATAEDFLGRCLLAAAVAPLDEGTPSYVASGTDVRELPLVGALAQAGVSVVMCGRPEGHTQEVVTRLTTLAEHAREVGRGVSWA